MTQDGGWLANVPSGQRDLVLHARGFVAEYRWGVDLKTGVPFDLKVTSLRRGASVVGWVRSDIPKARLGRCTLEIAPRMGGPVPNPTVAQRLARMTVRGTANDRGFFQLVGVPPGEFVLTARMPGSAPSRRFPVTVLQNAETVLRDSVILTPPLSLAVVVEPPTDPAGSAWGIEVLRGGLVSGFFEQIAHGTCGTDGGYSIPDLEPGTYDIRVTSGPACYHRETAELTEQTLPVRISLPLVLVQGTLTKNKKPLEGTIWFGGDRGAVRVPLDTDASGHFAGLLPHEGSWPVDVIVAEPRYARSLRAVTVKRPSNGRVQKLDITLPDGELHGRVVKEDGTPASGARAYLSANWLGGGDPTTQPPAQVGDDGSFVFEALPGGDYDVRAEAQGSLSEWQTAHVSDVGASDTVSLVLKNVSQVSGSVVSASGGVPAAKVTIFPLPRPHRGLYATTDVNGEFDATVPAGTTGLMLEVGAPGYAWRGFRGPFQRDKPVVIPVEQSGGTLHLRFDTAVWDRLQVLILHETVPIDPIGLVFWAAANGAPWPKNVLEAIDVPAMEPGDYALCLVAPSAFMAIREGLALPTLCARGTLMPGGELLLKAPSMGEK